MPYDFRSLSRCLSCLRKARCPTLSCLLEAHPRMNFPWVQQTTLLRKWNRPEYPMCVPHSTSPCICNKCEQPTSILSVGQRICGEQEVDGSRGIAHIWALGDRIVGRAAWWECCISFVCIATMVLMEDSLSVLEVLLQFGTKVKAR